MTPAARVIAETSTRGGCTRPASPTLVDRLLRHTCHLDACFRSRLNDDDRGLAGFQESTVACGQLVFTSDDRETCVAQRPIARLPRNNRKTPRKPDIGRFTNEDELAASVYNSRAIPPDKSFERALNSGNVRHRGKVRVPGEAE